MAGQLILSLSILVVLHEMGHFFPAKWFGMKVEKFYLFFDPYFEIFKTEYKGTEYGVGWLPLGGYVKIAGMMDESFDTDQIEGEMQDWEFRAKPAWQRLIVMIGGVTVNFILGFLIYWMLTWSYGSEYLPTQNAAKYGIVTDSLGQTMGLQDGDLPVAVGEVEMDKFSAGKAKIEIIINGARSLTVERGGQKKILPVSDETAAALSTYENNGATIYAPRFPFVVNEEFPDDSPAKAAGIQAGDRIIALDGQPTPYFHDFSKQIRGESQKIVDDFISKQEKGFLAALKRKFGGGGKADLQREVKVQIERPKGNSSDTLMFDIKTTKAGLIGAGVVQLPTETETYGLGESIPIAWDRSIGFLHTQIKAFGKMFSGELKAKDNLGSFLTIGKQFGGTWIWQRFWELTAALSLILGFINILPIPMLDGGHVMFLLYEIVSGRKPNEKFQEYTSYAGFAILICLMLYAIGLDIWRNVF